ncbi:hypothetical protein PUN28_018334 [Cardiocondyla obscurior]|uniref:Uncharacterized protein n=1 Tax=Cardiocondyla obscurior TaxID=286306 RepID=A0AAW2EGW3_9HYME
MQIRIITRECALSLHLPGQAEIGSVQMKNERERGLKQFLVIVRNTVHLRPPLEKSLLLSLLLLLLLLLLLVLLLLLFLKERNTGGFIVNRPVRLVVHVRIIEIREFRLERLHKQKSVTNMTK